MKKLLFGAFALSLLGGVALYQRSKQFPWFTCQIIQIDKENNQLLVYSNEGPYLGEMIINLPKHISLDQFKENMLIQIQGSPAMTMSLPPQLAARKVKPIS